MSVYVSVCVFLSVRDHIFGTTCPIFMKFFMHVIYGRSLVLLWGRNDTLWTSGLWMRRLLDVAAQLKSSAHAALGLAINCVQ